LFRKTKSSKYPEFTAGHWWDGEKFGMKDSPYSIEDARPDASGYYLNANFISPTILDPNNHRRMLAGGLSLWRTDDILAKIDKDSGPVWRSIKDAASTPISSIDIAKANSNIVWVCHNDGSIYRTRNATDNKPTWDIVSSTLPSRQCNRIKIDPLDSKVVYVAFADYVQDNLWATRDDGLTWKSIGAGLPVAPVNAIEIHPKSRRLIYVGTDFGVFGTSDGGDKWSTFNEGPANSVVKDLFWINTKLHAATFGRGMFSIDLSQFK
jgi:photosystem II stability/assembly factor-like uncharacterized protein